MFPDPRRRRPRFEYPGSAGAGPRQKSDPHLSDHREPLKASGQGRGMVRSESAGSPQSGEVDASEEGDRRHGGQGGGWDKTLSEKVNVVITQITY